METPPRCPYCHAPCAPGDLLLSCGSCQATLHLACWEESGACPTLGCAGDPDPVPEPDAPPPPFSYPLEPLTASEIQRSNFMKDFREGAPPVDPAEAYARCEQLARDHAENLALYESWASHWPCAAAAFKERLNPRLRQERLAKLRRRSPRGASPKGPGKAAGPPQPPPLLTRDLVEAMLQPVLALDPAARAAGVARIMSQQRQRWQAWAAQHPGAAAACLREHPEWRALIE